MDPVCDVIIASSQTSEGSAGVPTVGIVESCCFRSLLVVFAFLHQIKSYKLQINPRNKEDTTGINGCYISL